MAKEALFEPLGIPGANLEINTALLPASAAVAYERTIRDHFKGDACHFDLILLGLGDMPTPLLYFPTLRC